jgi:antagonist of KipI
VTGPAAIPTIRITHPGLLTTVQDLGRPGLGRFGVPVSGAMDPFAARVANRLAGNPDRAALLELTLSGEVEFLRQTPFAIAGGDLSATLSGEPVENWTSRVAAPGDRLAFGAAGPHRQGARAYLAVAGGILVPEILGSRATDLESRIGGLEGRPLRAGDTLDAGPAPRSLPRAAPLDVRTVYRHPFTLRFLPSLSGPGEEILAAFAAASLRVSAKISRMGYRLEGPVLGGRQEGLMASEPIPPGAVQLPAGGAPILLMADRQTVGGYPRLGSVIRADLPRAAQLFTGHQVRFVPVTLEEARSALLEQAAILARVPA